VTASLAAFDELDRKTVIVVLDSEQPQGWVYRDVSPAVRGAFRSEGMGNTIPKVVVSSPDQLDIWGKLDYREMFDDDNFDDLEDAVRAILEGEGKPIETGVYWWSLQSKDGYYSGRFVDFDEESDKVVLQKPDEARRYRVAMSRLAPGSIAYGKALARREAERVAQEHIEEARAAITHEEWQSADGRTIRAKFLSLEGGELTIEMKDSGREYSLPLERLSEASRERAREIAASLVPPSEPGE